MPAHILVVDDEPRLIRLMQSALQDAGYRVTTACDGVDALAQIQAERPDLVVLDAMMPRMDGYEALRRLKTDPETGGLPVLMLICRAADADVLRGWQRTADFYMPKPFNPMELLTSVKRMLKPPGNDSAKSTLIDLC